MIDTAFWLKSTEPFDLRWAYYELLTHDINSMDSGSAIPSTSKEAFYAMPVLIPPLETQKVIAATLGALDDKIESNRRTIKLIDEVVRARFDRDFDVEQVGDGIAIAELVGINPRRKLARGEQATYLGMSSLPEFSPVVLEWEERAFGSGQKFINGDVLMARITPCLENGKTAIVDMLGEGEVGWGSTEYVVLSPRGEFSTPWLYALTRHEVVREWAIRRMTGSSGRRRFQASGFGEYCIRKPDPAGLAAFNAFAVPMFRKVTQARDEMKSLMRLRDALLPELLSGRTSVPVGDVLL
ncbi:restriction endonuclease subunit S [Tessaracoccus sp. OH4464_COT-324]|uniref:restriction endonuclease subunit S n=1 Tax=Tessaracoccus sp. OH4464_COT-324 TaxID=2491059 RepID=UPI000F6412CD|nr:restriction endonuclease subunit S [Tessaracoccus sp. OH4464_COT-324]RRD45898.1 restriction endonuclease subunit S [Tessaracoccus sp. OH4464_COT-324]